MLPLENVRLFRRIRKHATLVLKMFVFRIILLISLENLQILPLGNVRLFRRIHKNDTPFLKTCAFFTEIAEISICCRYFHQMRLILFFILELNRVGKGLQGETWESLEELGRDLGELWEVLDP